MSPLFWRNPLAVQVAALLIMVGTTRAADPGVLSSPDGLIRLSIQFPAASSTQRPRWDATFRAQPLLTHCELGLRVLDGGELMAGAFVVEERRRAVDERIPVLFGKSAHANDRFSEVRYTLETPQHRRADVVFRCYNDAIA